MQRWVVKRKGQILFEGNSEDECWVWILHHQPMSVHWAMKYEGYDIEKIEEGRTITK